MGRWVGLRVGFININDIYNNDVSSVRGEHMPMKLTKQNKGWRTLGRLFTPSISYRHRYCTYLYYSLPPSLLRENGGAVSTDRNTSTDIQSPC
jgi:hypothetical protein